ncbi:hypothetical protein AAC387_Pa02g2855 [Persea americana]
MSHDPPKLYTNKPKKGQLKAKAKDFSLPAPNPSPSMAQSPSAPPKDSFFRRNKFVWPLILTVNVAVGAYLYVTTRKKSTDLEDDKVAVEEQTPAPIVNAAAIVPEKTPPIALEKTTPVLPTAEPLKIRQPIPADEQRELFKWILAEKRKVVPQNPSEKKRIDEEKAILKQYIRAKSIPVL